MLIKITTFFIFIFFILIFIRLFYLLNLPQTTYIINITQNDFYRTPSLLSFVLALVPCHSQKVLRNHGNNNAGEAHAH